MPSFEQLLDLGSRGGRTSIEGVGLNKEIQDAQAIQEHQADVQKVRRNERVITNQVNANIAQRKQDRQMWGTDDPKKIAAVKALGVLGQDAAQQAALDPEGFAERVSRLEELTGRGGVQDMPDAPPERDYYRTEVNGTLAFGNTPEFAADPRSRRYNSDSGTHKDLGAPGGEAGTISGGGSEGAVSEKPVEDVLFEGRLGEAKALAERPEKQEKRAIAGEKYFDEVFGSSPDIRSARQRLQDDWFSGEAKKRGLRMQDIKALDSILLKRGKKTTELTDPGIDKTFFKPWVKGAGRPGEGKDISEPATILNPGGGTSEVVKGEQGKLMATNEAAAALEETMTREAPKMTDYAQGKRSPQPRATPPALKAPTPKPGSHLASLEGAQNPIDAFVQSVTPAPSLDPQEALKRKRKEADPFGIGF